MGALGGYIDVIEHVTRPSRLGFSAFLLAGIVIGGALFTLTTGSSLPSPSYSGLLPFDPASQLGILAAMIGEGRLVGVSVVVGLLAGVTLQRMLTPCRTTHAGSSGSRPIKARQTMIFRPYYYFDLGCAAYLFGCGTLGKGAVVDARADDVEAYVTFAAAKGLRLTHVIDTHVHADHRSGGPELASRTGAQYCMHESADVTFVFTALREGDELELGNTRVRVLHTPGHSPESVCLVVTDLKRGPEPWFVLTGDTLFVGGVGRPDLPGRSRENAAQLYASLHDKLLTLPDDLEIYPGHFSGSVCGIGLSGKPTSTLAFEKRWNSMLSLDRKEFIEALSDVPPKPAGMEHVLAFNRGTEEAGTSA